MSKTITQFRWLVTMLLLVTAMAMSSSTWAQSSIIPSQPSGDGSENSPYQIGTAEELYWFAALVNGELGGETPNASANAVLTANITVNKDLLASVNEDGTLKDGKTVVSWTPIGKDQNPYTGTFDGQGHTISGLYLDNSVLNNVGLFGKNSGTIKNVGVVDSYFYGNEYVGGVCGYNGGTITGCYNSGTVSGNFYVGGVCGYNDVGTITGCYNTGLVSSNRDSVGGVCGRNYDGTITGCYNTGSVSGDYNYAGGVCGYHEGTITGCYNTGSVSGYNAVGGVCGYNGGTITGCYTNNEIVCGNNNSNVTDCDVKSDFTDGTVCPLLNTALKKVNASVRFYQGANYPEFIKNLPSLVEGVYQISNKEELYAFALLVNNGETSANAVLTADIPVNTGVLKDNGTLADDVSGFTTWTPIGNAQNPYTGTFDGQGHTISGLYLDNSVLNNVGLFRRNSGTIKNVGVVDSYFCGNDYVGGVCGYNGGTITGCYNTGSVSGNYSVGGVYGYNGGTITGCYNTGSVSGNSNIGGVCGYNNGNTITGCYNTGTVSGNSNIGGVCGYNNGNKITGCYNTGAVSGSGSNTGGVCGYNGGTITGCYNTGTVNGYQNYAGGVCGYNGGTITGCYTNNEIVCGNNNSNVTDCGENTNFTNGTVCPLLNKALKNANASVRFYKGANYPELIMNVPSLAEGVYQISNKEELYAFALVINKNVETSANAKLTADIVVNSGLAEGKTMLESLEYDTASGKVTNGSSFVAWTPIGYCKSEDDYANYEGTFDGDNHTISGLYFNDSEVESIGLFGSVYEGYVKNVGVVDSYFSGYDWVGGVCGWAGNSRIENCYNEGTVYGSEDRTGGVCGDVSMSTIENCYNEGTVFCLDGDAGGVCGDVVDGTIINCHNSGSVSGGCYVGGVCGMVNICETGKSYMINCYNTGDVKGVGTSDCLTTGGVCGFFNRSIYLNCYNTGTVSATAAEVGPVLGETFYSYCNNCYYLEGCNAKGTSFTNEFGTKMSSAAFGSGEVAYLLSQGSTVVDKNTSTYYSGASWGQRLGTDDYPVLSDYKVIKAAKGDNKTYWATFSNQSSDMDLSGLTVYTATVSKGILTLTPCTNHIVAKGEGVLVKGNSEYLNALMLNDKTEKAEANNDLVATPAEPTVINATTGHVLYRLTYNKISAKEGLGFYLGLVGESKDGSQLKATPGKAYLDVTTTAATPSSSNVPALGFAFPSDGETTGISEMVIKGNAGISGAANADGRIYNLQGQQVSAPAKGLYIKNNKKVIVK